MVLLVLAAGDLAVTWCLRRARLVHARVNQAARDSHPSSCAGFYSGTVPHHEDDALLPSEEAVFARIASEAEFGWIDKVIRAAREGQL